MLKHIPDMITPELFSVIDDMGRGDELVIADANFQRSDMRRVVRMGGVTVAELLSALLVLFPLDGRDDMPVTVCFTSDEEYVPPVWGDLEKAIRESEEGPKLKGMDKLEKYSFEKRCANARCVIITGDRDSSSTIIIKKGDA